MLKNKSLWIFASFFCLFSFALLYGTTHIDSIIAARGDYYFSQKDTVNAERFYESAFELGVTDLNRRINYVNLIINNPFTVDAQEKLVKFIGYPVEDGAKLKAEYFLYDMKREIFRKYQGNYIKKAVYNGKIIRWDKFPITYAFNSKDPVPDYFVKEIENAFLTWEKSLDHALYFEKTEQNPNIIIDFQAGNTADDDSKKYIVAYTTPNISSESKLNNMKINFYLKDIEDEYFTPNQVYNTALHEIAHALGIMGHSENSDDAMFMSKDSKSVYDDTRTKLTQADINTMKLLYNVKPDITNAYETKSSYIPAVVLGNDKEVTNSKIREAKFYIKKAPHLPMGYIDLAMGYVSAQDYAKAIKALEKALQVADSNEVLGIIYYNLAVCYYYIDNTEVAKDNLVKSLQIQDSEEKRFLLAEIYSREGNIEKAIEEYGSLIKQHPKNIEYTIALTNIYVKRHEYINARKVLKAYFIANPNDKKNPRFAPYGIVRLGL